MTSGLVEKLADIVGSKGVITDPFDMAPFLEDWRGLKKGSARCVVLPSNTAEVSAVMRLLSDLQIAVYPQGGNTGLCYGAVPAEAGGCIVLSLNRMRNIRSIDRAAGCIVVDAGVVLEAVHAASLDIEKSFPMHLGSEGTAQIGGLVATNAGGTNALRYGSMRDLVYGLEIVLPNGDILSDLEPLRKNNIGYDLKHLYIGGEGTLGIITAASLKLHPALRSDAHAWLAFDDPANAVELLEKLQDHFDTSLIAFELLSKSQVALVLGHVPRTRQPFDRVPDWSVLIELGAPDPARDLRTELEDFLGEHFETVSARDAVVAQSDSQADDFWHVRHSVSEANKAMGRGHTHDIAVRVSLVPQFLKAAERLLAEKFPRSYPVVTCHLGDGNIHYIAMYSNEDWDGIADKAGLTAELQKQVHDIAQDLGGTFSAEHGIGRKLTGELMRLGDENRLSVMRCLKAALDPHNLMNPGILFEADQTVPAAAGTALGGGGSLRS